MTRLLIAAIALALSGCSQPLVDWQQTTQQYDLNDIDQDGVIEARERCVGSLQGTEVNNNGCGNVATTTERRHLEVRFPNDSATIDDTFHQEIAKLAEFMNHHPQTQVTIEGHSSRIGQAQYNLDLSQRRAEAVQLVLINTFGIAPERLQAKGYGFEKPLDAGNDNIAHSRNRRVMADIASDDRSATMRWTVWTVGR